jgi:uncharacterized protein (DUF2225 family)
MEDLIELDVYGEVCCDDCGEIIHNHIDCPVCKNTYASTSSYCDLSEEKIIECDVCYTVFKKISDSWYTDCLVKIIRIQPQYK